MFLEVVRQRPVWDDIFGFARGWWQYVDTDLRSESPLLGRGQWERLLAECAFCDVTSFSASLHEDETDQAVFVAFAPQSEVGQDSDDGMISSGSRPVSYLVFADQGGIADALVDKIEADGGRAICVRAGDQFQQDAAGDYLVAPDSQEHLRRVLATDCSMASCRPESCIAGRWIMPMLNT